MAIKVSPEVQHQAIKIAKGTQKQGQTKEQTKLIAQGIEKGIAEYKKQQNKKSRTQDKLRKVELKNKHKLTEQVLEQEQISAPKVNNYLPWALLVISWLSFVLYLF